MPLDKKYYIHCRAGCLGSDVSTAADVDAIIADLSATRPRNLILHFHGGLISCAAGFKIAETLLPVYQPAGTPVFYVWESGAWETIRNNLTELADEPVFKELLRKVMEHALKRLGGRGGARSIAPGEVTREEVRATLDNFIAHPGPDTIPYKDIQPATPTAKARSAASAIDVGEIQADLETDSRFKQALATLPDIPPDRRSALQPGPAQERRTAFAEVASERLSEEPGRRGFITVFKAAMFIKDVLVALLRRYGDRRDHGFYATCVEEIVRAFKIGGSGANEWGKALEWNRMKKDCSDAFGMDPNVHAGTALLSRLRSALQGDLTLDRMTLVGHSTGAIYICDWLEAAHRLLPAAVKFDVVLLAPAVTYARFAAMLKNCGQRIGQFRMFAMSDPLERDDQVWGDDPALGDTHDWRRYLYPSSLLYLVSGILESAPGPHGTPVDTPDMPLLGMQRFFAQQDVYDPTHFPEVHQVRTWLQQEPRRTVWSFADDAGAGLNSHCNDHGAFDNEPTTLTSLRHIVTSGF